MLDYIDTDRQKKPASILRISGLIVLLAAVATFGYYLFSYGLPEMKSASAQVTAPTAMPTVQPAQAVQVTTRPVDSTDLVLPTNGSYLATGTNNATRAWFRRVPAEVLRNHIYAWGLEHHTEYAQKYYLSCEAAVIRIALAPLGIHLTEDRILSEIPFSDDDPEQGILRGRACGLGGLARLGLWLLGGTRGRTRCVRGLLRLGLGTLGEPAGHPGRGCGVGRICVCGSHRTKHEGGSERCAENLLVHIRDTTQRPAVCQHPDRNGYPRPYA